MSILIKGMEMPKDCPMCPMAHWNGYGEFTGCEIVAGKKYADKTDPEYMASDCRPDWCPLVHVPPHGRLIEYHAAVHAVYDGYKEFGLSWRNAEVMLGKLPTIIPAEEDET